MAIRHVMRDLANGPSFGTVRCVELAGRESVNRGAQIVRRRSNDIDRVTPADGIEGGLLFELPNRILQTSHGKEMLGIRAGVQRNRARPKSVTLISIQPYNSRENGFPLSDRRPPGPGRYGRGLSR